MYKIMIIDDNHISVDGICHNIDWSDLNAEVVYNYIGTQDENKYLVDLSVHYNFEPFVQMFQNVVMKLNLPVLPPLV